MWWHRADVRALHKRARSYGYTDVHALYNRTDSYINVRTLYNRADSYRYTNVRTTYDRSNSRCSLHSKSGGVGLEQYG